MEGLASINVQVHVTVSYNYMSSLKKFPCDTYINMLNIYRLGIQVLYVLKNNMNQKIISFTYARNKIK